MFDEALDDLVKSSKRAVWEQVITELTSRTGKLTQEECNGCGNYDDVASGASNDTLRSMTEWCRKQKEQGT